MKRATLTKVKLKKLLKEIDPSGTLAASLFFDMLKLHGIELSESDTRRIKQGAYMHSVKG